MASSLPLQAPISGAATQLTQKKRIKKNTTNPFAVARQPGGARPQPVTNGRPAPASRSAQPLNAPKPGEYSGFTDPKLGRYTDYRLVVTKRDLMAGLRHHILHLADNKKNVDIRDQSQFPRPAHLHRRDPAADSAGMLKDDQAEIRDGLTVNEREEQSKKNEVRKQEREANLAQIAPTQSSRKAAKQTLKTKTVYHKEYTEEEKRRIQTNYEEKLPWHLEDFDSKHCFVGENQAPSAHRHAAFAYERTDPGNPKFRLIPVEKIYEFRPKRKIVQSQTLEDVEAAMKKRANMPEWLERVEQKSMLKKKEQTIQQRAAQMYTGAVNNNKFAGRTGEGADLDFDDDELFADDEEGDVLKIQDEDEEHAKKRIKEDQLKANYFEVKEEHEFDEEEKEEQREEQARKANFRKIRKALEKHEHDYNHASDSEYSDSSDSDEERARMEAERLKNLEAQGQTPLQIEGAPGTLQPDGTIRTALPSGATTPSASTRKSDKPLTDTEGTSRSLAPRKRPGSPILSEAGSGTDTSIRKKKHKSKHLSGSVTGPVSRSGSPVPTTTTTSSSNKLKPLPRRDGTPSSNANSNLPSRPASAAPNMATGPPQSPSDTSTPMPSLQDIRDTLTRSLPEGLTIPELLNVQPHPRDRSKEFIQLVKTVAKSVTLENGKKVLVLKGS